MLNMKIRRETEVDYRQTEMLVREAFWNVYRPGCVEHLLLHRLRKDACFVPELDYIMEENGRIVAQIAYARCVVAGENGETREAVLFGPVSVAPDCQRQGYGQMLIAFTLAKAKEMGFAAVLITGSPAYYARFGFVPAAEHGIIYGGVPRGEETPFFLVKILDELRARVLRGVYTDPEVYKISDADAEAFDLQFPPKVKEIRPGQLT